MCVSLTSTSIWKTCMTYQVTGKQPCVPRDTRQINSKQAGWIQFEGRSVSVWKCLPCKLFKLRLGVKKCNLPKGPQLWHCTQLKIIKLGGAIWEADQLSAQVPSTWQTTRIVCLLSKLKVFCTPVVKYICVTVSVLLTEQWSQPRACFCFSENSKYCRACKTTIKCEGSERKGLSDKDQGSFSDLELYSLSSGTSSTFLLH